MAVTSLVFGIISLVIGFFFRWLGAIIALVGIILGAVGRKNPEKKGIATAGLVLSIIGLVISIIMLIACNAVSVGTLAALGSSAW